MSPAEWAEEFSVDTEWSLEDALDRFVTTYLMTTLEDAVNLIAELAREGIEFAIAIVREWDEGADVALLYGDLYIRPV